MNGTNLSFYIIWVQLKAISDISGQIKWDRNIDMESEEAFDLLMDGINLIESQIKISKLNCNFPRI